jgi:hypothetical protein
VGERTLDLCLLNDAQLANNKSPRRFGRSKIIFVPPYNRVALSLTSALSHLGFAGLSAGPSYFESQLARFVTRIWVPVIKIPKRSAVSEINAHIDLIDWRHGTAQNFDFIAKNLVGHLRLRRGGFL